ncbi:MAG: VCBS repeat-containing protein [Planctomycetota bacterium]
MTAADLDLDGNRDLIAANAFALDVIHGPASIGYLEAGFKVRIGRHLPPTGEAGFHAQTVVQAGDFDRDGREDIVMVNDRGGVSILRNIGPQDHETAGLVPTTKEPIRLKAMDRPAYGMYYLRNSGHAVADFDNDGQLDLIVAGDVLFLNEIEGFTGLSLLSGDGKGGLKAEQCLYQQRITHLAQGRIDGNGIPDIVFVDPDGRVGLVRFLGGARTDLVSWAPPGPASPTLVAMGDLDDDGTDELVLAGGEDGPQVEIYDLSPRSAWTRRIQVPLPKGVDRRQSRILSMCCTDLNGDRLADLALLVAHDNALGQVAVLYGDGKGGFDEEWSSDLPTVLDPTTRLTSHWLMRAFDLDGDLNPELVVGGIKHIETEKIIHLIYPNLTPRTLGVVEYGTGQTDSAGLTPTIAIYGGEPRLGNRDFGISLGRTGGGRRAALMMYYKPGGPWQGPGFQVNVFPRWSIGATTSGGPSCGQALLPLAIPDDRDLLGCTWHFQWLVEDQCEDALFRVAVSRAIAVSFGPR